MAAELIDRIVYEVPAMPGLWTEPWTVDLVVPNEAQAKALAAVADEKRSFDDLVSAVLPLIGQPQGLTLGGQPVTWEVMRSRPKWFSAAMTSLWTAAFHETYGEPMELKRKNS